MVFQHNNKVMKVDLIVSSDLDPQRLPELQWLP